MRDGHHEKLANVEMESYALYLEQAIESFLELEDWPVRGEYRSEPELWTS